jgi:hypothetical protein
MLNTGRDPGIDANTETGVTNTGKTETGQSLKFQVCRTLLGSKNKNQKKNNTIFKIFYNDKN